MRASRLVLLLLLALPAAGLRAQEAPPASRMARITYLTTVTAYVDAGREDGLVPEAAVTVLRRGQEIGVLRVTDLSSRRAACRIERADLALEVGDSVRFTPVTDAPAPVAPVAVGPAPASARSSRARGGGSVHGRVGARLLFVKDATTGQTLVQPAMDVRVEGARLGGSPLGMVVDVRARYTSTGEPGGAPVNDGVARAYQAALVLQPVRSPLRVVLGRQMSPTLATIAFLDGVLVELRGRHVNGGVFGGVEPDPVTFGMSSAVRDVGGYLGLHSAAGTAGQWSVTLGGVGSYMRDGAPNREFAFAQGSFTSRRVTAYLAQEVDFYRSEKVALGEDPVSLTSTVGLLRWRVTDVFGVHAGYDSRRAARLFFDTVNPETTFDASARQGAWGGVSVGTGRFFASLDARTSLGGENGQGQGYTATAGFTSITRLAMAVRGRGTRYVNDRSNGWLGSLSWGMSPGDRLSLELNGGYRTEQVPAAGNAQANSWWVGGVMDVRLARPVYLMLSASHQAGELEANEQGYLSLSYRF